MEARLSYFDAIVSWEGLSMGWLAGHSCLQSEEFDLAYGFCRLGGHLKQAHGNRPSTQFSRLSKRRSASELNSALS